MNHMLKLRSKGKAALPCLCFVNNFLLFNREDFSGEVSLDSLVCGMFTTGFQATNVGLAINEINRMVGRLPY